MKLEMSMSSLSEVLSHIEARRTAHEVPNLVSDRGRDLKDMEEAISALEKRLAEIFEF